MLVGLLPLEAPASLADSVITWAPLCVLISSVKTLSLNNHILRSWGLGFNTRQPLTLWIKKWKHREEE